MIEFITANLAENPNNLAECQRLFHGRGHAYQGLSHVNVDWFSPVILVTLYQAVEQAWLEQQVQDLCALVPACRSIQVQHRYQKMAPTDVVWGEEIDAVEATESELKYAISFGKAQNSGLFLDMRNGRDWLKAQAKDKNILNLFSYTCAFSVAAIAGGAQQVVNVDLSKASLNKGRDNHRLNGHDTSKVVFQGVDIFKSYSRLKKYGPYDILVCDPPSFQKGSVDIARDYSKILRRIPQLMKPGGDLLLCLNSPDLDEQFLFDEIARECPECQFIEKIDNPKVFKEAHQGKGLKALLFKYNA